MNNQSFLRKPNVNVLTISMKPMGMQGRVRQSEKDQIILRPLHKIQAVAESIYCFNNGKTFCAMVLEWSEFFRTSNFRKRFFRLFLANRLPSEGVASHRRSLMTKLWRLSNDGYSFADFTNCMSI